MLDKTVPSRDEHAMRLRGDRKARLYERTCGSKKGYRTKRQAIDAAIRVSTLASVQRPYKCPYCQTWHLTGKPEGGGR